MGNNIMKKTDVEGFLMTSESKSVSVLLWLMKNRDKDNMIDGTLDSIAEQCGVTKVTVNRVFQKLYEKEFLVRVRNSKYQLKNI